MKNIFSAFSLTEFFTWICYKRWRKQIPNILSLLSLLCLPFLRANLISKPKRVPNSFSLWNILLMLGVSCLYWIPSPPTMTLGGTARTEECFVRKGRQHIQWQLFCWPLCATIPVNCVLHVSWRSFQYLEFWPNLSSEHSSNHAPSSGLHLPWACWHWIQSASSGTCTSFCENLGVTHCFLKAYCSVYSVNCKYWHLSVAFFPSLLGPRVQCRISTSAYPVCLRTAL